MQQHDPSVMRLAGELAEKLGGEPWIRPVEQPQIIDAPVARPGRADVWPPEVLEEIRRVYSGEDR
jgi:hypothetical protein